MKERYNVLDLFCGAGGMSYGFEQEGFNILTGIDIWEDAIETYRYNHPSVGIETDISETHPKEIPISKNQVDVIIGGPPCKGFSLSGKRDPDDERNQLVPRFIEYVDYFEPQVTVMENVVGILSMEDGDVVEYIHKTFEDISFNISHQILNADDFGVAQKRRRVFFIAVDEELGDPSFPDVQTPKSPPVKDVLESDFSNHPNHSLTSHSDDIIQRMSEVEYNESLYDNYTEAWKRLHPEEPAPTIKENHGAPFIHYEEDRVGTPRECAAIQSFPSEYVFKGSKSSQLKQIGNAVPPKLSKNVAREVKKSILIQ